MKLCKDCIHYKRHEARHFDACLHPDFAEPLDMVRGEPRWTYCQIMRADDRCGPNGDRWERRDE